jgi:parallel beta-helix repeat protein
MPNGCRICMTWILAAGLVHIGAAVLAVDRYVSPSGTEAPPYTNWNMAARSIQSAVDGSVDGDVIWVTNGMYSLTNEIGIAKAVTVRSIDISSRSVTVNGGAANRCFNLSHPDALIAGFVITNGFSTTFGGGVEINEGGIVSNCLITGNRVTVNTLDSFGGGGVDCFQRGQLLDCDIVGNTASGTNVPQGGGVMCQGGGVVVRQCLIERNAVISLFTNGLGGGMQCMDTAIVQRCTIRGNIVQGWGGGVCCERQVSIADCTLSSNSATLSGGGFYVQTGSVSVIERCLVQGNSAAGVGGGGYVRFDGIVLDSLISGNSAGDTTATNAGGLFFRKGGSATNCTIVGNTASAGTGGVFLDDSDGTQPTLTACIVYSNQPSNYAWSRNIGGGHYIEYSCLSPDSILFNGLGNITNAPLWRAANDYHLRPDSPCIDVSTNGTDGDIEGLTRPMDGNFDGIHLYDMGCYEFSTNQDSDANGLPDGWEYRYFGVFTGTLAEADTDGDTVTNLVEFQQGSNPRDDTSGTPNMGDSGLPSGWLLKYGLSVSIPDPNGDADADGVSNIGEMIAGTNPKDTNSYPALLIARTAGKSTLRWLSAPGRTYTVTETTNLLSPAEFSTVQSGLVGPLWPSTNELILSATTNFRCYRLIITRP